MTRDATTQPNTNPKTRQALTSEHPLILASTAAFHHRRPTSRPGLQRAVHGGSRQSRGGDLWSSLRRNVRALRCRDVATVREHGRGRLSSGTSGGEHGVRCAHGVRGIRAAPLHLANRLSSWRLLSAGRCSDSDPQLPISAAPSSNPAGSATGSRLAQLHSRGFSESRSTVHHFSLSTISTCQPFNFSTALNQEFARCRGAAGARRSALSALAAGRFLRPCDTLFRRVRTTDGASAPPICSTTRSPVWDSGVSPGNCGGCRTAAARRSGGFQRVRVFTFSGCSLDA